jgi:sirohydrochlorin cobaltochelatase
MKHAIVLFGHGSRDPLWHKPIEHVAAAIAEKSPNTLVACAYLELSFPDLPSAVQQLVKQGATSLRILPMFLGVGRHAREDLPALVADLRPQYPNLQISLGNAVGEHPALVKLLATIALERS